MNFPLSPRELAAAIGVSESSVKRWVDGGLIRADRTPGGHRRIAWAEALRFIRDSRSELRQPEGIGLRDVARARTSIVDDDDPADGLFQLLRAGEQTTAGAFLLALYLGGRSVAQIVDGSLRPAMERIGELWREDDSGIFREHRATDIAVLALTRLRQACAVEAGPVTAVGGAPAGDPYLLPSLAASIVLAAEGLPAVNLGPDTPLADVATAARELSAGLVWLSVSSAGSAEELSAEIRHLAAGLAERGVPLVVGGAQAGQLDLPERPNLVVGGSMAELAALVRGWRLAGVR